MIMRDKYENGLVRNEQGYEEVLNVLFDSERSWYTWLLKTNNGKHLVELKRELNNIVGYKGVQLVTISQSTAYGVYAPYHFVDTEQEFKTLVRELRP